MFGTRANGGVGSFTLVYKPEHGFERNVNSHVWEGQYVSKDVDVYENFNDMGVWVMAAGGTDTFNRNRWVAECYQGNYGLWLKPTQIYGRLMQIEPPDTGGDEECTNTEIILDPYDPCEDNGGSVGTGGGTQYAAGDYTGGETVDWNTGVGNGGGSECGAAAVVEYVCIDYWDGTQWVEWSCGYATTC
jgi:hypothetical protein